MEDYNVIPNITDVDKICRICLSEKEQTEFHYLYDSTLDNLLWKLTDLPKPNLGDALPSYICKECVELLKISATFKERCQKSDEKLRHILLIFQTTASNATLKELLCCVFNNGSQVPNDKIENKIIDASVQTENTQNKKRKKRKGTSLSLSHWSSDDELFIETSNEKLSTNQDKLDTLKKDTEKSQNKSIPQLPHKCNKCRKSFCSAAGLQIHLIKHSKKLQCEVCGKQFALIKQLNNHTKLHKDYKPYICEICKKGFTAAGNLSKHMRIHGGEKRHECITCGRRFYEPGHLAVHIRTHTGEKPIVCKVCGKRFSDPHSLITHNKIHTGERNYECKICGKRFAHSFVLTAHYRIHTGEKPYQCSICSASFAASSYLKIHKRTHTHEKPFSCASCPKAFVSRCALVAHNMIHTGEKRFQCSVCGKRVARAGDLTIHIRSHTGERPYSCDKCLKRYHTSSNLSAHKRTHLGIKNHICTICEKGFGDSRTLKSHIRIHTGEKPYVCPFCNNRYSQSGQLAAHRKTHLKQTDSNNLENLTNTNIQMDNVSLNSNTDASDINISTKEPNIIAPLTAVIPIHSDIQIEENKTVEIDMDSVIPFIPLLKIHRPSFNDIDSDLKMKSDLIDSGIELEQFISLKSDLDSKDTIATIQSLSDEQHTLQSPIRVYAE